MERAQQLDEWEFAESPPISLSFNIGTGQSSPRSSTHGRKMNRGGGLDNLSPQLCQSNAPLVSKRELWSYYLYSNSTNGVGPAKYSLTLFQALVTAAGHDRSQGPGSPCKQPSFNSQCVVEFGGNGRVKNVNSVILIANGLSFGIMTLTYTLLGPLADHGQLDRWLLFVLSVTSWVSQFAFLAVTKPVDWKTAMALYILGFTTYGATLVFFAAALPNLSRHTVEAMQSRREYARGLISFDVHQQHLSLQKSRISTISSVHFNIGYLLSLLLSLSVLIPLSGHAMKNNYALAISTAYAAIVGIWWLIFQKERGGRKYPKSKYLVVLGWMQLYEAIRRFKLLPHTFTYLVVSFFLADGVNTCATLVNIVQSEHVTFSFLQLTYFNLVQAGTSILSVAAFWYIQKYFNLKTKQMFWATNVAVVLIPLWGTIGIFSQNFGLHKTWEFWVYNFVVGIFQTPYYAYSVTMMAELTPPGYENMFFGLYGFSNRAASFLGPNVIQAVINKTGSNWTGFPFLFASTAVASSLLWFVNVEKGREDALGWRKIGKDSAGGSSLKAKPLHVYKRARMGTS